MKDKTIEALRGSIEKWHNILHADGEDKGSDNCPLCTIFLQARGSCTGCPIVEKKSDFYMCHNPEYQEWFAHQEDCHWPNQKKIHLRSSGERCPTCRELAQAEYDFLKDLLIEYLSYPPKKEEWTCGCPQHGKSAGKKKEEWEDITNKIEWGLYTFSSGNHWLDGIYIGETVVYFTGKEMVVYGHINDGIKIEVIKPDPECREEFRILKRV